VYKIERSKSKEIRTNSRKRTYNLETNKDNKTQEKIGENENQKVQKAIVSNWKLKVKNSKWTQFASGKRIRK